MPEDSVPGLGDDVSVEQDGHVAVVTLRRPPHNLLTVAALAGVADALHGVSRDVRAVVLAAEGSSFCAGANFRSRDAPDPTEGRGFEQQTSAFYEQAARVFESPVPVVAAIHGAAIGAGFGLALACDVRVVGERGWFQANFVRLGIHPGFALSVTLPQAVGASRAAELFLTGRRVDAPEAQAMGIAHEVAAAGSELAAAHSLASAIAAAAPLAVAATRATLRAGLADAARAAMRHELAEQTVLAGTADAVEGVQAMLERREPRFEGR